MTNHPNPDLETHLSHLLSLALLALSLLTFLLSGAITLSTSPLPSSDTSPSTSTSPYAKTILILTTLHHAATASFSYARYAHSGQSAFGVGVLGSGGLAAMGGWVLMFGLQRGGGRRSRWPFENAGERERRKERRREKFGVGVGRKGI